LRDGNQFPDMQLEKHPTIPEMNGYYVGRVKNYKEYYEIAAKQCAEILGDPENPHQLDPDFENIWKTVNFTVQSLHRMRTGSAVQNSPSKEKPTSCLSTTMAITCTVTELWVGISGSGMPKKKKTAFYSRCL